MNESVSLNATERARALDVAQRVRRDVPEAVPCIRELLAAGMIAGWRNITYCGPPREIPGAIKGPFRSGLEMTRRRDA